MHPLIRKLQTERRLSAEEYRFLLTTEHIELLQDLRQAADAVRTERFSKQVFLRGLIEITNHCKNDCLYCGIRRSNAKVVRYRMTPEQIMSCCALGAGLGYRTFVLQGGEDGYWTDARLVSLVAAIRQAHPDCAITLSLGERSRKSYAALHAAGANRYLLRHETANAVHYARLHPSEMRLETRMQCLRDLRKCGYQVGCGMMIGSPYQTIDHLIEDLQFIRQFEPEMVGIGPFLPHCDTPFGTQPAGSAEMTVRILSIVRLLLPDVLLPATTALGTLQSYGLRKGVAAGANVIMMNLTPSEERQNYLLYNGKNTAAHDTLAELEQRRAEMAEIGYALVHQRGDAPSFSI